MHYNALRTGGGTPPEEGGGGGGGRLGAHSFLFFLSFLAPGSARNTANKTSLTPGTIKAKGMRARKAGSLTAAGMMMIRAGNPKRMRSSKSRGSLFRLLEV